MPSPNSAAAVFLAALALLAGARAQADCGAPPAQTETCPGLGSDPVVASLLARPMPPESGFDPRRDSLSFANYGENYDPSHVAQYRPDTPGVPEIGHCTTMARLARMFRDRGNFRPARPRASLDEYRGIVRSLVRMDPTLPLSALPRRSIVIPGYASLAEFSADPRIQRILVEEMGPSLPDFFNDPQGFGWHPFDNLAPWNPQTERTQVSEILDSLGRGELPILYAKHGLGQNHAMLAYGASRSGRIIRLRLYDSNHPAAESWLDFDACSARWLGRDQTIQQIWRYRRP